MRWFEIYVNDLNRAIQFYETVFGMKMTDMPMPETGDPMPKMKFFPAPENMDAGGAPGALVEMSGMPGGGGSTIVYFGSADCAVEAARVEAAGGKLMQEKMLIGDYGFIAMAQDTEGNMIGIHSTH